MEDREYLGEFALALLRTLLRAALALAAPLCIFLGPIRNPCGLLRSDAAHWWFAAAVSAGA